ncbi:hypothetical protein [Streptomyces sp. SHP 1-2]|uniref:hypothetical protein n=1 Tax=Streptomyces sp. SHP 1-2 TaxID=2769489 RepID=UPI002238E88B|nr:hypothetical protein [Streptomyces sp. SHP 1-2]MCW5250268.1 hypothetical protein [Streptomyces sp. SHP 1-2]
MDRMDAEDVLRIDRYLRQVMMARGGVLHLACAWNALHFGFDVALGAYHSALLDPQHFHVVRPVRDGARPAVPTGAFLRIERGTRWLWAEAVGKFGLSSECDDDGWLPAARSGDRAGSLRPDGVWGREEALVVDITAFGPPSPVEVKEIARLHRSGLLDERGHVASTGLYPAQDLALLEDVAYYQRYLLTDARPLLATGPLGGLLDDPHDADLLARALTASFGTVADLLRRMPDSRLWGPYAVAGCSTGSLPGPVIDEVVHRVRRPRNGAPCYTAVWPLLRAACDAAGARYLTEGPTALASLATLNLAIAGQVTEPKGQIDLRVDDLWQQGGVWRAQQPPLPWYVNGADPLTALGIGHGEHTGYFHAVPLPPGGAPAREESVGEVLVPLDDTEAPLLTEETRPGESVPVIEHLDDHLAVYTCCLLPRDIDRGALPLPASIREGLADGSAVIELHHDGDLDYPRVPQESAVEETMFTGVDWPWSFYPGIRLTVTVPRGGRRVHAVTTLLEEPLQFGDDGPFLWDCDLEALRRHLGLPPSEPGRRPSVPPRASRSGCASAVDSLCSLIVAALRQYGTPGMFGTRSIQGHRLSAVLFGPGPVPPALLGTVIHSCEDLAAQGLLEREGVPGEPDLFTWWPADAASARGRLPITLEQQAMRSHVKAHYVPPGLRKLPPGQQPSAEARSSYARWRVEMLGAGVETTLPNGYTFVRGHRRGVEQPPSWHEDLTGCS